MATNDHTVPQMYLRRFGRQPRRRSKNWFVTVRKVGDPSKPFDTNTKNIATVTDFYRAVLPDGSSHHKMERLFCMIETAAAPVFEAMLDEDPDYALPRRWPLQPDERITMAWWIAAQILRTTRQARRIEHLAAAADGNQLSFSQSLRSHVGRNEHLRFIGSQIEAMAWVIFSRPWGLGYSLACLLTGDVPALIMNAQDHEDQIAAVAVWGITLPLDPHRCLIVPGLPDVREDPQKAVDHLAALESPFGLFHNQAVFDAADSCVIYHAEHDPFRFRTVDTMSRLPRPGADEPNASGHEYYWSYAPLPPGHTVERRWLTEHEWEGDAAS